MTSTGELCNGAGTCECGVCKCNATSNYKGPTCEECPTCPGKCEENKNCSLCVGFQSGPLVGEGCTKQCAHVTKVPKIDEELVKKTEGITLCQFNDEIDDCRYFFTYKYVDKNKVEDEVQEEKVCPESVNILAIVLGTIGGIVLIGLILLLIWKLITSIHDRQEFAKLRPRLRTLNGTWERTPFTNKPRLHSRIPSTQENRQSTILIIESTNTLSPWSSFP